MRFRLLLLILLASCVGCRPGAQAPLAAVADGTPWKWQSDAHGFEVTIPTERWKVTSNPNVLAKFDCLQPLLVASIIGVRPAGSDAEFEAAVATGAAAKEAGASNVIEYSKPNRHGRLHWLYVADLVGGAHPRVFGTSVTRVGNKAVLIMFEGPCRQSTEAGRLSEAQSLRTQAELFLGSVR